MKNTKRRALKNLREFRIDAYDDSLKMKGCIIASCTFYGKGKRMTKKIYDERRKIQS